MKSAKFIILPALYTAILIGGQFVLSGISGIEIVTVLLLAYCYKYGVRQGLLVATAFSLLRCLIFGFFPSVIVLYLLYYNLFAIVFGSVGNAFSREYSIKKHAVTVIIAVLMTVAFTLLDDIITPLMFGFTFEAAKAYFLASIYTMIPQIVCTFTTVIVIFPPLLKVLK